MKKLIAILFLMLLIGVLVGCSETNQLVSDGNKYNQGDESFTIVFENNDGTIISNLILKYDEEIVEPKNVEKVDSARYHYEFIGWDINGDGKKDEIPETAKTSFVARALYSYTLNTYNVIFNVNCDSFSGELNQNVNYGETAIVPTELVKEGYSFEGWDKSYDYIVGDTVVEAIWELETFNINLHCENWLNIDSKQNYEIPAYYGYFKNIKIPNVVSGKYAFLGWKDKDGNLLTNQFGDLFKPLSVTEDLELYLSYDFIQSGSICSLGRMNYGEVTDESLVEKIGNFATKEGIEDGYLFFDSNYYNLKDDKIYNVKYVDYVGIQVDNFSDMYFDNSKIPYIFITKDILYSSLAGETVAAIEKYKADVELIYGTAKKISLPFATVQPYNTFYPFDPTIDDLNGLIYSKNSKTFSTSISTETTVLDTANIAKDNFNFLVSKSNNSSSTPIYYTNKEGVMGEIDAATEYGIRIMAVIAFA